MTYSKDVIDLIEDLRNRTTNNITSIQAGLIPEFVNTQWSIVSYYIYDGKRYDNTDRDVKFIKVNNVRYKSDNGSKDQLVFSENAQKAIEEDNLVNPFVFFINGQCIKWSDITVVRELKYSYFVVKNTARFGSITDVQMIHIPFKVNYTENREFNDEDLQLFRFNDDGLVAPYGKIVYTANIPELNVLSDSFLDGAVVENYDLNFNTKYKLNENNFIVFKDKKLYRNLPIHVYNLNVITLNEAQPIEGEISYKIFYRAVVNENISNITVPYNDSYLKQIITKQIDAGAIDINTLESDFNFAFDKNISYEENLINGLKYIHLYRQFLTNPVYEKRSIVRTLSYTGAEIKEKLDSKKNLRMLRWKYKALDTFVMVFKNNLLHERYRDLHYEANTWVMPILEEIDDNDIYEIVYFRFVNNAVVEQTMPIDENWITRIPFTIDELQIASQWIPDQFYGLEPLDRTRYLIDYTATQDEENPQITHISFTDHAYFEPPIHEPEPVPQCTITVTKADDCLVYLNGEPAYNNTTYSFDENTVVTIKAETTVSDRGIESITLNGELVKNPHSFVINQNCTLDVQTGAKFCYISLPEDRENYDFYLNGNKIENLDKIQIERYSENTIEIVPAEDYYVAFIKANDINITNPYTFIAQDDITLDINVLEQLDTFLVNIVVPEHCVARLNGVNVETGAYPFQEKSVVTLQVIPDNHYYTEKILINGFEGTTEEPIDFEVLLDTDIIIEILPETIDITYQIDEYATVSVSYWYQEKFVENKLLEPGTSVFRIDFGSEFTVESVQSILPNAYKITAANVGDFSVLDITPWTLVLSQDTLFRVVVDQIDSMILHFTNEEEILAKSRVYINDKRYTGGDTYLPIGEKYTLNIIPNEDYLIEYAESSQFEEEEIGFPFTATAKGIVNFITVSFVDYIPITVTYRVRGDIVVDIDGEEYTAGIYTKTYNDGDRIVIEALCEDETKVPKMTTQDSSIIGLPASYTLNGAQEIIFEPTDDIKILHLIVRGTAKNVAFNGFFATKDTFKYPTDAKIHMTFEGENEYNSIMLENMYTLGEEYDIILSNNFFLEVNSTDTISELNINTDGNCFYILNGMQNKDNGVFYYTKGTTISLQAISTNDKTPILRNTLTGEDLENPVMFSLDYDQLSIMCMTLTRARALSARVNDDEDYEYPTTVSIIPDADPGVTIKMDGQAMTKAINVVRDKLYQFSAEYDGSQEYTDIMIETIPVTDELLGKPLTLFSKKQFRYVYYNVQEKTCMFRMSPEFKTCLNPEQYMVFINGRMLTNNMYRLLIESKNNAFLEPCIHTRVMCNPGDRIEIFYLPTNVSSTNIGDSNKTEIIKVEATTDNQPMFTIPFPFANYLYGKNSFIVILGSVIVDPSRYNVIGNKLIFIDEKDYVAKGRELTFIFFYTQASTLDELAFVKEEDHILIDSEYVIAETQGQLTFEIPWPQDSSFARGINPFFLTYRSLYINPSRYTVDLEANTITFKYEQDGIDLGAALVFTYFYPQNQTQVTTETIPVAATKDNQLDFTIPLPFEDYFKDNNKFFVTLNGTFLTADIDYTINENTLTLTINGYEGLKVGEEIIFNFNYGEYLSVKSTMVQVRATQKDQLRFKLPSVFDDYNRVDNKFFVVVGTTFVDPRRYVISDGYLRFLNDFDAQPVGNIISFLIIYTENIRYVNSSNLDFSAANKYTKVESIPVKIEYDGQKEFVIPKEDTLIFKKQFFVTLGSTFISDTLYKENPLTNSITFTDEVDEGLDAGREVLFTFIDNDYLVIEHEIDEVFAEADGQMVFNIPLPFDNYIELGNQVLVFNGRTFLDPDRYIIDEEAGTLTLLDYEDALDKNRKLVFMFVYIANQLNTSYDRDDVSAVKIQKYGYIYLAKSSLKYALDKKLYFLFINGKKIELDSIIDVAANIIRVTRDIQSRYNVCIIDYTPQIEEFAEFNRILSEYDQILNKIDYEQMNTLFNIYTKISDTEPPFDPDISQEAIINDIIRYHYVAQGISEALPFTYTYDNGTLRVTDEYGNFISDAMDASKNVNPNYEHIVN